MNSCFVILPIFGLLVALVSTAIAIFISRKSSSTANHIGGMKGEDPRTLWHHNQLDQKVEAILEQRLDGMVEAMTEQVPMAKMLLSSSRVEKLKGQAHIELMKALPEIRYAILHGLQGEARSEGRGLPAVSAARWKNFAPAMGLSASLGIVLGLIVATWM